MVREAVGALLQGRRALVRLVRLAGRPLCQFRAPGRRVYDAMWNYEATLKETNDKLKADGQGAALCRSIRPTASPSATSPLGFIDHGRGAGCRKILHRPACLSAVGRRAQTHRRHRQAACRWAARRSQATAEPDWNFDPGRLVTSIRMPEPAVIRKALDLYQEALAQAVADRALLRLLRLHGGRGRKAAAGGRAVPVHARGGERRCWCNGRRRTTSSCMPFDSAVRDSFEAQRRSGRPEAAARRQVAEQQAGGGTDMYACAEHGAAENHSHDLICRHICRPSSS